MKLFLTILLFSLVVNTNAQVIEEKIPIHDPVMIKEKDTYYLFGTGWGISVLSSKDMKSWKPYKPVFLKPPAWAVKAVTDFKGHIWAPDITYRNGTYYLYYSVSSFAKNTSCIGVATSKTLDTTSKDYGWTDHGKLIQSVPNRDMWNAIDPSLIFDENNTPWLAFGSFWAGMKMVKLDSSLTTVAQPEKWHTIARRQRTFELPDSMPGDAAIEAPFIFKKDKYYYLFVSWDYCCRAEKSDYKVVVGRSEKATGPYLDKTGKSMFEGGGTMVVQGDNINWFGAGHNSTYTINGKDYIIYHGYDARDKGRSKLIIEQLKWEDGWPVAPSQKNNQ